MRQTFLVAVLGLGTLTGCGNMHLGWPVWPADNRSPVIVEATPPPVQVIVAPPPEPEPILPPQPEAEVALRIGQPPRKPEPPPRPPEPLAVKPDQPVVDPAILVGLDQPRLEATLGRPSLKQEVAPAKIWQYTGDNCVFTVFFYLDIQDQTFRAVSFKTDKKTNKSTGGKDGEEDAAKRCLAEILASYQPAP